MPEIVNPAPRRRVMARPRPSIMFAQRPKFVVQLGETSDSTQDHEGRAALLRAQRITA
jgi:hypothetical protein